MKSVNERAGSKRVVVRVIATVIISSAAAIFAQTLMKSRLGAALFAFPADRGEALSSYAIVSAFETAGLLIGAIAADRQRIGPRLSLMAGAMVLLIGSGLLAIPGLLLVGGAAVFFGAGAVTSGAWAGAHRATAFHRGGRDGTFALIAATNLTASIGAGAAATELKPWSIGICLLAGIVAAGGLATLIASRDAFNVATETESPSLPNDSAFRAAEAGLLIALALGMAAVWAPEYAEMSAQDGFERPLIGSVELAPWMTGLNVLLSFFATLLWFSRDRVPSGSRSAMRVVWGLLLWGPGILLLSASQPSTTTGVLVQLAGTFAVSFGSVIAGPLLWSTIMARAPARHPALTLSLWSLGTSLLGSYLLGPILWREEGVVTEIIFTGAGMTLGLTALALMQRRSRT